MEVPRKVSSKNVVELLHEFSGNENNNSYIIQQLRSPLPPANRTERDAILDLLKGFGPHFLQWFGRDLLTRLDTSAGVMTFLASINLGEDPCSVSQQAVAHSSVYVDDTNPSVGALFNVFTAADHRRQGLSKHLVELTCKYFDSIGGQIMVLGTGSPFAARTYARMGFVHLNGGFGGNQKGYNPDDMGEWIMIRMSPEIQRLMSAKEGVEQKSSSDQITTRLQSPSNADSGTQVHAVDHDLSSVGQIAFRMEKLYSNLPQDSSNAQLYWQSFDRRSYAQLCLLFNADGGRRSDKMMCCGITDGLTAEEQLIHLLFAIDEKQAVGYVLYNRATFGPDGIAVGLAVKRFTNQSKANTGSKSSQGFYSIWQDKSDDFLGQDAWLTRFFALEKAPKVFPALQGDKNSNAKFTSR